MPPRASLAGGVCSVWVVSSFIESSEQLALEQERSCHRDLLAFFESRSHFNQATACHSRLDGAPLNPSLFLTKTIVTPSTR